MRAYDPTTGLYSPGEHDERYLVWMDTRAHRAKTVGTHVPLSGDVSKIAKIRRLAKKEEAFRARLLATPPPEEKPRSRWPKRPMGRGRPKAR